MSAFFYGFTITSFNSQKIRGTFGKGKSALKNPLKFNGFLTISIGVKYFSKNRIRKYMLFGLENFSNFMIIICDFLARYNYMARGLSENESIEKANKIGEQYLRAYEKIRRQLVHEGYNTKRIKIIRWKEVYDNPKAKEMIHIVENHYEKDKNFQRDCDKIFKKTFHKKKVDKIAIKYLLEELALFFYIALLYPGNYTIEIYSGENIVQKNIFLKKYHGLYEELELNDNYGHIHVEMNL